MKLFNQCDRQWGAHALGWYKPGTICAYGCFCSVLAAIANDSGNPSTPASFDDLLTAKKLFVKDSTGTFDLLPDEALDLAFPGQYKTTHYSGFRLDLVKAAIPTPDTYVYFWVTGYSPLWKSTIATHFILAWTANGQYIGDPEGGIVRLLADYGGPLNVHKTGVVKRIRAAKPVTPAPVPTATMSPPPVPVFSCKGADGWIAPAQVYASAVKAATTYAKSHAGVLIEVIDAKGATVESEFQPLPPTPLLPGPVPLPSIPPSHAHPDGWGVIQSLIIQIILALRRVPTPGR